MDKKMVGFLSGAIIIVLGCSCSVFAKKTILGKKDVVVRSSRSMNPSRSVSATRSVESEKLETIAKIKKKFSAAVLLHGLAGTCDKLQKALSAQNEQEKQEAALGIVSSLLTLAGDSAEKDDIGKERVATRAAKLTDKLLDMLKAGEVDVNEFAKFSYLSELAATKDHGARKELLASWFKSKETAKKVLMEVFLALKMRTDVLLPDVFKTLNTTITRGWDVASVRSADLDEDGCEISQSVLKLISMFWTFVSDVYKKEDIGKYLKTQLMHVWDFIKNEVMEGIEEELAEEAK